LSIVVLQHIFMNILDHIFILVLLFVQFSLSHHITAIVVTVVITIIDIQSSPKPSTRTVLLDLLQ